MTLKHFIDRPILAAVISIVIVLGGIIGVATLPVEQYPDIAPPTVMVRASYPGASAETIQKSVIIPLEEAINGVENMMYIKSEASNAGSGSITVYFKQGTDADMAAVNVQNKVATATGSLPAEVTKIGVTTMKRQSSMLKVFTLSSPDDSYDENFLSNYLNINIKPRIQRIQGVGEFFALGGDYAMRIWMKPDVMAQYKLIPSDVTAVLAEQNIESAAGMFGENSDNTFQYTMKYRGRKMTPEEFGEIVIRATSDGQVLRLKDIADIELGQDSYAYHGMVNGHPGVSALVFQTAGTNATQTVEEINAMLDEIATELPKGMEITHLMSVNDYLYASIHEVIKTLIEAIILVVLVVYVFLQDIRSTLIPTISILVSLVGTFAFLSFAGFSINLLTLFALVLAIGTVVDDAIIVVDAVQARLLSDNRCLRRPARLPLRPYPARKQGRILCMRLSGPDPLPAAAPCACRSPMAPLRLLSLSAACVRRTAFPYRTAHTADRIYSSAKPDNSPNLSLQHLCQALQAASLYGLCIFVSRGYAYSRGVRH